MSESCDFEKVAALCDEHKRLEAFVGTFRAEVKMWMGPGDPFVAQGTMINSLLLGGRYLQEDYKGDPGEGPFPDFAGRGYWGFNTITRKFEGLWMDTASTFMTIERGDVDESGKVWTMIGEFTNPGTGEAMKKRTVITLVDADHYTMESYFPTPDGGEFKNMEIRYERA